jgi:hypothetical protein
MNIFPWNWRYEITILDEDGKTRTYINAKLYWYEVEWNTPIMFGFTTSGGEIIQVPFNRFIKLLRYK